MIDMRGFQYYRLKCDYERKKAEKIASQRPRDDKNGAAQEGDAAPKDQKGSGAESTSE